MSFFLGSVSFSSYNRTSRSLSTSYERLSSGYRLNSAADDPAGMAVAENLSSQARSAAAAQRNITDGISITDVADGAAQSVSDALKRIRELAVEASDGTLTDDERSYLDDEAQELVAEIDRLADTTEFGGTILTDGSTASMDVQVGTDGSSQVTITLGDLNAAAIGINGIDLSTQGGAQAAIDTTDTSMDNVNDIRADLGVAANRLEYSLSGVERYEENLLAAESRIRDVDYARESANSAKFSIQQQMSIAVMAQANQMQGSILGLFG